MSKGNVMDFIEEVSKERSPIRQKFLDELKKPGITPEQVLKIFHDLDYKGVSLDDCTKLLNSANGFNTACQLEKRY